MDTSTSKLAKKGRLWLLCIVILLACLAGGVTFEFSKSDWAAWVQAIGSVAAIIAAVKISSLQLERENRQRKEEEWQLEMNSARVAWVFAEQAFNIYRTIVEHWHAEQYHRMTPLWQRVTSIRIGVEGLLHRPVSTKVLEQIVITYTRLVSAERIFLPPYVADSREHFELQFSFAASAYQDTLKVIETLVEYESSLRVNNANLC